MAAPSPVAGIHLQQWFCVVPKSDSLTSPGSLSEMQITGPHPRPTEAEKLGVETSTIRFNRPSRWFYCHLGWEPPTWLTTAQAPPSCSWFLASPVPAPPRCDSTPQAQSFISPPQLMTCLGLTFLSVTWEPPPVHPFCCTVTLLWEATCLTDFDTEHLGVTPLSSFLCVMEHSHSWSQQIHVVIHHHIT